MDLIWGFLALGIFGAIIFVLVKDAIDQINVERHKHDKFWGI